MKQSFLLVDYYNFTLVIGQLKLQKRILSPMGVSEKCGAGGQLFLETELPIGGLQ